MALSESTRKHGALHEGLKLDDQSAKHAIQVYVFDRKAQSRLSDPSRLKASTIKCNGACRNPADTAKQSVQFRSARFKPLLEPSQLAQNVVNMQRRGWMHFQPNDGIRLARIGYSNGVVPPLVVR